MNTLKLTAFALASIIAVAHANPRDGHHFKNVKEQVATFKFAEEKQMTSEQKDVFANLSPKEKDVFANLSPKEKEDYLSFVKAKREQEGLLAKAVAEGDNEKAGIIAVAIAEIDAKINDNIITGQ